MAADYHNEYRSHPPEYRTRSGSSNSWMLALVAAALIGLLAFFTFSGSEQPARVSTAPGGVTSTGVAPQPQPEANPVQTAPAVPQPAQ